MLGLSAKMNEIIKIGKKYNIPVIEDAAEAMGGKYNNKYLGTIGDIGCYSLDYAKTITTGEGGVIVTNNDEYYKYMIEYIDHGHENNPSVPRGLDTVSIPGFNYRITEMQGAIGKVQLKKLDFIVNENTKRYKVLEKKLGFLKIRTNIAKNDDTLHDTFMFMVREKELNKLILDYCIEIIGIKNVPTAFNWHFCSFWNHIISKEETDYINPSFNIIKEYIAIPILLKKTEEDYLKIADDIIEIYNVYYKNIYKESGVIHIKDFFNDYEYLENINDNIYRYINEHKNLLNKYDYNINSNGLVTDAHCLHKYDDYFFSKLIKNKNILNLCEKLIGSKLKCLVVKYFLKDQEKIMCVEFHGIKIILCGV